MSNLTRRQTQIIQSAFDLVSEKGIQGLTIKNLSLSIGISEPAIYRHFTDKISILKAMIEFFHIQRQQSMNQFSSMNIPCIEKLKMIFLQKTKLFQDNPSMAAVIFSEEIFQNEEELKQSINDVIQNMTDMIKKIIQDGQNKKQIRKDIKAENITLIYMGSLRLLIKKWRNENYQFPLDKEGGKFIDDLIKMIAISR